MLVYTNTEESQSTLQEWKNKVYKSGLQKVHGKYIFPKTHAQNFKFFFPVEATHINLL